MARRLRTRGATGRVLAVAGLAALLLASVPACAEASYLSIEGGEPGSGTNPGNWEYTAADGEANRLTVSQVGDRVVFRDTGAAIEVLSRGGASTQCMAGATSDVGCLLPVLDPRGGSLPHVEISLTDGNDSALMALPVTRRSLPIFTVVSGGDGDDSLTGTGFVQHLDGDGGDDRLTGGRLDDELNGGPGADRIDGGAGTDSVSYLFRDAPLRVDLRRQSQGPAGEGDVLISIENVQGSGPSRLIGNARQNELSGSLYPDVIIGGAGGDQLAGSFGNDRLYGGPGRDRMYGDGGTIFVPGGDPPPGSDYLSAIDNEPDQVDCGGGPDIARVDPIDTVIACERVFVARG